MQDLSSFLFVVALWLGASVGLWWVHREGLRRKRRRQREVVARIWSKVRSAQAVYDEIRQDGEEWAAIPESGAATNVSGVDEQGEANSADPALALRNRTTMLLRRVQEAGPFFDSVRALHPEMQRLLGIDTCPPLSEILQIRRDLWAASEIILIDDIAALGDAFAEPGSYKRFCEDARRLLFKGEAEAVGADDLLDLRLSVARTDVELFAAGVEEEILAAEERERLPTPAEIISYPVAAVRAIPGQWRVFRAYAGESMEHVRLAARNLRESQTVAEALSELRRAREEFPGLVNASLDKAAALARNGRESIVAHQHLLAKAYDLQAKYQEALQRAPELSDRGRQFIARLELKKRSEQLRETSKGLLDDAKRVAVRGLAHLIAVLQTLQERLAVPEPQPAGGVPKSMAANSERQSKTAERVEAPRPIAPSQPALAKNAPAPVKPSVRTPAPGYIPPEKASPPKAAPKPMAPEPPVEEASQETLDRLSALFGGRGRAAKSQAPKEPAKAAAIEVAKDVELQPPSAKIASRDVTGPAVKTAPTAPTRRLWPALDKLRSAETKQVDDPADPVAPLPKTPPAEDKGKKEPRRIFGRETKRSEAAPAASESAAPEKAQSKAKTFSPRRSLFGTKKQPEQEIIPPTRNEKLRRRGAGGPAADRPEEGSIAEMLQRLRLADAELLEVEAFGAPQPMRPRPPSLLSKLSTVSASSMDAVDTLPKPASAKSATAKSAPAKAPQTAPSPTSTQTAPATTQKSGFSIFRRKKA